MKTIENSVVRTVRILFCLLLATLLLASSVFAADERIGGLSPEQALQAGERMYREGILPNGEPMQAYVQGDIPINGTMFSCQSCHLRSGLGSAEGTQIVFPVNAAKLFIPLRRGAEVEINPSREKLAKPLQPEEIRPAYDDETLAQALRSGKRPNGEELKQTMPRYLLNEEQMQILSYYLHHLSASFSAGVSDSDMQLATIVTEGVVPQQREAMLKTLETYLRIKNAQNRPNARRAKIGPWYRQGRFSPYRTLKLSVWELKGSPDSWPQQLAEYYRKQPVFALVAGLADGDWRPIHEFCEQNRLPCIFPLTERPVVSTQDWYTLYFSRGPYQEGISAARFLRGSDRKTTAGRIIQLISARPASRSIAEGFRDTWQQLQQSPPVEIKIAPGKRLDASDAEQLIARYPNARFLLWLDATQLGFIRGLAEKANNTQLFASAKLLGDSIRQLPENVRDTLYFTYPERLPKDRQLRETVVKKWLQTHRVPIIDMDIQGKVYFLGWMLSGALQALLDEYYQDYLLDVFDMMNDEYYSIINYPRVSFGQGQRYAAKGCYIVQLGKGPQAELIPKTDWVVQ